MQSEIFEISNSLRDDGSFLNSSYFVIEILRMTLEENSRMVGGTSVIISFSIMNITTHKACHRFFFCRIEEVQNFLFITKNISRLKLKCISLSTVTVKLTHFFIF